MATAATPLAGRTIEAPSNPHHRYTQPVPLVGLFTDAPHSHEGTVPEGVWLVAVPADGLAASAPPEAVAASWGDLFAKAARADGSWSAVDQGRISESPSVLELRYKSTVLARATLSSASGSLSVGYAPDPGIELSAEHLEVTHCSSLPITRQFEAFIIERRPPSSDLERQLSTKLTERVNDLKARYELEVAPAVWIAALAFIAVVAGVAVGGYFLAKWVARQLKRRQQEQGGVRLEGSLGEIDLSTIDPSARVADLLETRNRVLQVM